MACMSVSRKSSDRWPPLASDAVAAFMAEMELRGASFNRVIRYHQAQAIEVQQTTACNAYTPPSSGVADGC